MTEVFDELVSVMPNYANLYYDNLGGNGELYPNADPEHSDGTVVLFDERFNTDDGLAHLVPAQWLSAKELPDADYPLVLNTGRLLEHWHTGSMTLRSYALDTTAQVAEVYVHPKDAADRGLTHSEIVRVRSRRGQIELRAVRAVAQCHRLRVAGAKAPRGGAARFSKICERQDDPAAEWVADCDEGATSHSEQFSPPFAVICWRSLRRVVGSVTIGW